MTFRLSDLYPLGRPLLFQLDAEQAHEVTLSVIERGQNTPLQCAWAQPLVQDPFTMAGLKFGNRIGLAAGLDKNGRCIDGFGAMGFGSIEVGTVTPKAQAGNPRPRIFRIPEQTALINRLGFNNEGLDAFLRNVQRAHSFRARGGILGLNIGKNAATPIESAASDYVLCLQAVYPHADYICINISSPNTKNLRTLQSDEALDALLGTIEKTRQALADQHGVRKPVFLKIAPDLEQDQIKAVTSLLQQHRIDGVVATNTTVARDKVQHLRHGSETGGLSGGPVLEASNIVIRALRKELGPDYPIIGVGGITDAASTKSKLDAGASIVQVYTALIYKGPSLVREVASEIAADTSTK